MGKKQKKNSQRKSTTSTFAHTGSHKNHKPGSYKYICKGPVRLKIKALPQHMTRQRTPKDGTELILCCHLLLGPGAAFMSLYEELKS